MILELEDGSDVIKLTGEPCPGDYKCHGCTQWCDRCGDVGHVCDYVDCDVHKRIPELRDEYIDALNALEAINRAAKEIRREFEDAEEAYRGASKSQTRCMVPRSFRDHNFARTETSGIAECVRCGQKWRRGDEKETLKSCNEAVISAVMES
jgi:hypothetical protein